MPDVSPPSPSIVRFATFEVDLRSGELRNGDARIALQGQPFQILEQLVRRPGELVTRDELRRQLWPDNTFVDFEHGLNAAIRRLREALGDSADEPRFIETLPRRGYRFIAPVEPIGPSAAAAPAAGQTAAPPARERRAVLPGGLGLGVLLGALLGAVLVFVMARLNEPGAAAPGNQIAAPIVASNGVAVAVFENRTADPSLDSLGWLVADRIIRATGRVDSVVVLPQAIDAGPAGDPLAVARQSGASILATGAYYVHERGIEFQARILDAPTGRLLHAVAPQTGALAEPAGMLQGLEQVIAGAIAMHFDDFFGGLDLVSHPPTLDAYGEYRAGLEVFESDYPRSLSHLERAVAIDPAFLVPRVVAYFARGNLGDAEEADAILSDLERGMDRLTPAERLFVEFLRASRELRYAQALRALEDLEPLAPASLGVNFNIVQLSMVLNRPRAAVEAHDRLPTSARSLRHSIGTYRLTVLAQALHLLGDHDRELRESRLAQQYAPGVLGLASAETRALVALGRFDELERVIDQSLATAPVAGSPARVMEESAKELRAHGHREASIALASRAADWHERQPPGARASASAREQFGRTLYLAERWEEAGAVFAALLKEQPGDVWYQGWMGAVAARTGDVERARQVAAGLGRLSGRVAALWRATIAALIGEPDAAVALFRDAFAQGLPFGVHLHNSPHLESLRAYGPFIDLMRPEG